MKIIFLSILYIYINNIEYQQSKEQYLPQGIIDGSISVMNVDFGELHFKSDNDGSDILSQLTEWSEAKITHADDKIRESLPEGWIISQDAPARCIGLQNARLSQAKISLLSNVSSHKEYIELKKRAFKYFKEYDNYKKQEMKKITFSNNYNDKELNILNISLDDQLLKKYVYLIVMNEEKYRILFNYFESLILTLKCNDFVNGYSAIKDYILNNGWPLISEYGNELPRYIFLYIQHFSFDPDFLYRTLHQIKSLTGTGEINPRFYPDLYDKIAIYGGSPQRFGTFFVCVDGQYQPMNGLEDEDKVDARRQRYGLPPLSEKRQGYPDHC